MKEDIAIAHYNTTAQGLGIGEFLTRVYETLYASFGPQHWWPAETPFEVAVGAILTQNTNWLNVEKAIFNLKINNALDPLIIHEMPLQKLSELIIPSGYHNVKAARLKAFIEFLVQNYRGVIENMKGQETKALRTALLEINGIGPETADSILLYALEKPVFVIDAYTKRVIDRHGLMDYKRPYGDFQALFQNAIGRDIYNNYHALFVRLGKYFCKPKPLCAECPLKGISYPWIK
ncbi:MAG: endonuclease III domain-containing protein [Nitrospirae bacterium]|nr:endonuclease III domain-containing protein [Nitrospirota bacterium]